MSPDGVIDPDTAAALMPLDPHLAAAMTAITLALIACVFLLVLINQDQFRR